MSRRAVLFTGEDSLPSVYTPATRIDRLDFTEATLYEFIKEHCVKNGKPMVVSNFHKTAAWSDELFTLERLNSLIGDIAVEFNFKDRGLFKKRSIQFSDYINDIQTRYNLRTAHNSDEVFGKAKEYFRLLYAKDLDCPNEYKQAIGNIMPEYLLPHGYNDLFSYVPERYRAENFMCYLGQDGTGTPLHRDLCGTMGHNIMVYGAPDSYAEWIIVENQYRDRLAQVLKPTDKELKNVYDIEEVNRKTKANNKRKRSTSNSDKDTNKAFAKNSFLESDRAWLFRETVNKLRVPVYVIIQKPGDLVLIPSRAYHQVRNKGVCMKMAWNRITPQTLLYAFEDQLPLYKIINRPETYKCKGIVACTIKEWNKVLSTLNEAKITSTTMQKASQDSLFKCGIEQFKTDTKILSDLLLNRVIAPELLYDDHVNGIIVDDNNSEICSVQCDFCYSDIFHRYYHCEACEQYDLCLDCYSLGRSCQHPVDMKMYQSAENLMTYLTLYRAFVRNLSQFYGEDVVDCNLEDSMVHLTAVNASNLATTCRRIERYRRMKSNDYNALDCSHCGSTTNVLELGVTGVSLSSIFQRGPCQSLQVIKEDEQVLKIYVCSGCTSQCQSCLDANQPSESLVDFNLVYYVHPSFDGRSQGGFVDSNISKTCEGYCGSGRKRSRLRKTLQIEKTQKRDLEHSNTL